MANQKSLDGCKRGVQAMICKDSTKAGKKNALRTIGFKNFQQ